MIQLSSHNIFCFWYLSHYKRQIYLFIFNWQTFFEHMCVVVWVLTTAVIMKERQSRLSGRPMAIFVEGDIGHSPQSAGQVEQSSASSQTPSPQTSRVKFKDEIVTYLLFMATLCLGLTDCWSLMTSLLLGYQYNLCHQWPENVHITMTIWSNTEAFVHSLLHFL